MRSPFPAMGWSRGCATRGIQPPPPRCAIGCSRRCRGTRWGRRRSDTRASRRSRCCRIRMWRSFRWLPTSRRGRARVNRPMPSCRRFQITPPAVWPTGCCGERRCASTAWAIRSARSTSSARRRATSSSTRPMRGPRPARRRSRASVCAPASFPTARWSPPIGPFT